MMHFFTEQPWLFMLDEAHLGAESIHVRSEWRNRSRPLLHPMLQENKTMFL